MSFVREGCLSWDDIKLILAKLGRCDLCLGLYVYLLKFVFITKPAEYIMEEFNH